MLEATAESFRRQHHQGQKELSENTQRIVRALPQVFREEQSEAIDRRWVTLGEITDAVRALKRKKSPGVDQFVAEAYQNLSAPELDELAGSITEVLGAGKLPVEWRAGWGPCTRRGIT